MIVKNYRKRWKLITQVLLYLCFLLFYTELLSGRSFLENESRRFKERRGEANSPRGLSPSDPIIAIWEQYDREKQQEKLGMHHAGFTLTLYSFIYFPLIITHSYSIYQFYMKAVFINSPCAIICNSLLFF